MKMKLDKKTAEALAVVFEQFLPYKPISPVQLTRAVLAQEGRLEFDDYDELEPKAVKGLVKRILTNEPNLFENPPAEDESQKQVKTKGVDPEARKKMREMMGL